MEQGTSGLILRTRPFSETSLVVHWLTRDFGRLSTVAKGARRPKSPFLGKLDLFHLVDFTFHRSRRSELHTLREARVREYYPALRADLGILNQAAYFARLIEQTTEVETPLPAFFELLRCALHAIAAQPQQPLIVFAFESKLLCELGLQPDLENSGLSLGSRELLKKLMSVDWQTIFRFKASVAQTRELGSFLGRFLAEHLPSLPPGRTEALAPSLAAGGL